MRASESREQLDDHCENAKSGCFSWGRGRSILHEYYLDENLKRICELSLWMNESRSGTLSFVEGSIHRKLHHLLEDSELWSILCSTFLFLDLSWGKFYPRMLCTEIGVSVASTPKSHLTFLRSETRGKVWFLMQSKLDMSITSSVRPQNIWLVSLCITSNIWYRESKRASGIPLRSLLHWTDECCNANESKNFTQSCLYNAEIKKGF